MGDQPVPSFLESFFRPRPLDSFHSLYEDRISNITFKVYVFRDPNQSPQLMEIKGLFPSMTIRDLKTKIYMESGKNAAFFPNFQALLIPRGRDESDSASESAPASIYRPLDFYWMKAGGQSLKDMYVMDNPFERVLSPEVDDRFVTSDGNKRLVDFVDESRFTLKDYLPKLFSPETETIVLHLFLYADIYAKLPTGLRLSEREWFGRIEPFFPGTDMSMTGLVLNANQSMRIQMNVTYVTSTLELLNRLENLLQVEQIPLKNIHLAGIKFLRIMWPKPQKNAAPLETLFYQLSMSHERPFLRMLPADATPVTKLYMQSLVKIPDVDPRLLLEWAQERSPSPDRDYLFAKVIVRSEVGTQGPLYGTLRMFDDGTGDFILTPPKQIRRFEPDADLDKFADLLEKGIEGTPLLTEKPSIGEATLICGIELDSKSEAITKTQLRERLKAFAPFFYEIPPLPDDNPLVMLRYKGVSNFSIEKNTFSFLTQLKSRRMIKGEGLGPQFISALMREFPLSQDEAEAQVGKWIREGGDFDLSVPESKDYILRNNPGIDIGIFAQHPFYTFHLYRVDSLLDLRYIITALSILFSADDEQLSTSDKVTTAYIASQRAVTQVSAPVAATETEPEVQQEIGSAAIGPKPNIPTTTEPTVDPTESSRVAAFANTWGDILAGADDEEEEGIIDLGDADEEAAQNTFPKPNVGKLVTQNTVPPKEELQATGPLSTLPHPTLPSTEANENDESETEEDGKKGKKVTYKWFLKSKLQEADQRLFVYESKLPGVKIKKYVTMCQATETRQPEVLNKEQYLRMKAVYEDYDVHFIEYPLDPKTTVPAEAKTNTDKYYTVLKYGSDPAKQNYYICCEFFCIKDYIMVRESDFYSTKDLKNKDKPKGSCPFCHGLEIKSLNNPGKNETVIHRKIKKKSDRRHLFVGFLKETFHPEGFYQPCCFLDKRDYYLPEKEFQHIRGATEPMEEEESLGGLTTSATAATAVPFLDYAVTLARAYKKYIVGPEKFPLKLGETDGPQIGLLLPLLDTYFAQNPADFVSREFNRMELKPDSQAFLRVGVENRSSYLADSFFSCLAPYLFRNNAQEVKDMIDLALKPWIFQSLNYGNLLLEFYDPSDSILPTDPNERNNVLQDWAKKNLIGGRTLEDSNRDAIQRLYMSYHRFMTFVNDSTSLKEYRQFAQALARPGLFSARGLILIVLDVVLDADNSEHLEIRCPPFGLNMDQYGSADIGFVLHHYTGVWEPIFYSDNRSTYNIHESTLRFQRSLEAGWPEIVKKRVSEFTLRCAGPTRSVFTSEASVDANALIPLHEAINALPQSPAGIIRDAYNHIVGIVYRAVPGKPRLVALPVVDDGTNVDQYVTYYDWDDFKPAYMDELVQFYQRELYERFSLYPGYKIKEAIRLKTPDKKPMAGKFVAVQLANGLYVPAQPPKDASKISSLKEREVTEIEWTLNKRIAFSQKEEKSLKTLMKADESDFNEIFEHLRLTFSQWFARLPADSPLRQEIEDIIFDRDLPLFERRKRLEIKLGPKPIMTWMDTSELTPGESASLLRVDCTLQTKPNCTGRCVWRQGPGTGEGDIGRCYLHAPARSGAREVNGARVLMLRLLEELLRFPARRKQLLENQVSTLVELKDKLCVENYCIYPENSLAWFDLLRLDWVKASMERKKFHEEMSVSPENMPAKEKRIYPLLQELFGSTDPNLGNIYLFQKELDPKAPLNKYLVPFLGTSAVELGMTEDSPALTKEAIKKLVMLRKKPIVQIDMRASPPSFLSYGPSKAKSVNFPHIFIITKEGPAMLSASPDQYEVIQPDAMPEGLYKIVIGGRVCLSDTSLEVKC